jgi:hypothetical protein
MLILSISIMGIDIENHSVFQKNKMIVIQLNDTRPSNRKRNKNNKNKNEKSSIINCYLKWDDHIEEKSYLEEMHNEIIRIPVEETSKSLHKIGYLGYLREEAYNGESFVIKHLFFEAWSEDNNDDNNKKEGYCKVNSDVLKARLPKAIKITIQREELEDNKNKNKNKTITATRIGRQQRQKHQQQKEEKEDYSPRVKSLKDFVQLFEQKEKEGKNPRVYVSY